MSLINGLSPINIIVKNDPSIINLEEEGTVTTQILSEGKYMIIFKDYRKKSIEKGEITQGIASVKIQKGSYSNFKALFVDLHDTRKRKSNNIIILDGDKINIGTIFKTKNPIYKLVLYFYRHLNSKK
jgi:hypothetical protein